MLTKLLKASHILRISKFPSNLKIFENLKKSYTLIRHFNIFMDNHTLHGGRRNFSNYQLQAFSTAEILKSFVNYGFKTNDTQMIKMPKKGQYFQFKNHEKKSPFMYNTDLEIFLVPEDNRKQNLDESCTSKYQKNACFLEWL